MAAAFVNRLCKSRHKQGKACDKHFYYYCFVVKENSSMKEDNKIAIEEERKEHRKYKTTDVEEET